MRSAGIPALRLKRPSQVFYGWWMVGITVFSLAVIIAPVFQGMTLFFVALQRQFGWSHTLLSVAFSLTRAEGALLGPLEGFLTDRLGTRRMILIGYIIAGAGLVAFSFIQNIVGLFIVFVVIFTGVGLGGFIPLMSALNHWFIRRRSLAMAIGLTGINLGGLLMPAMAWAIIAVGWRTTALGLGIAVWLLAVPIASLVRNRPEDYGLRPDGDPPLEPSGRETTTQDGTSRGYDGSFSVGEALQTSAFWVITASHGFSAIAAITIGIHIAPALTNDSGMSLQMAATIILAFGVMAAVSQVVGGLIGDRFPKPPLIATYIAIQASGILVVATIHTVAGAFIFALLYGIGFGGRVPLLTAIRGDYFGRRNFATILGVSQAPMNLVMMGAPIAAGYLFDRLGSYTVPFLILAGLNLLGASMILLARKPALPVHQGGRGPKPGV